MRNLQQISHSLESLRLERSATYGRLFQNPNVVAIATTDRDAWLFFLSHLTSRLTVFLGFYKVNFLCFRRNRVNIQGVSTDKAARKFVHKF